MILSKHLRIFRTFAAAGVLIGTLAASAYARPVKISYSGSAQFVTGDYIFTEWTNSLYLFNGITMQNDPFHLSANIPLIVQSTPWITYTGSGLLPSGGTQNTDVETRGRLDPADPADYPDIGLGDLFVRGDAELLRMEGARPSIQVSASVKVPVADSDRGFGTGEWDAGSGLSMATTVGGFFLFAEGMYWILGDLPDLELRNAVSYGFAAGHPFAGGKAGFLASLLGYTRTIEDIDPPLQAALGFNYLTDAGSSINASCAAGLSESAPDFSISVGWLVPLKK
jgi:hypothetical protein